MTDATIDGHQGPWLTSGKPRSRWRSRPAIH